MTPPASCAARFLSPAQNRGRASLRSFTASSAKAPKPWRVSKQETWSTAWDRSALPLIWIKKHIVGIGGGVGIAPILFMARKAKPGQMTVVIGGRNKEEVFWKDLFPKTLKELIVTTDDGSYGIKGFSVSVLPELFKNGNVDEACVCGPGIMMRITAQMAKEANVPCEVSMERRMGCGIGTCLGCVCDRADGKGHYKVCVDGPVFKAEEVVL